MIDLPFLDLRRRSARLRRASDAALDEVLERGTLVLGPAVDAFEAMFAEYCGVEHGIGVASGTDAVTLALEALGVGPGDEVITVANTCVPTITGILASGATPVLVDSDPGHWNLDPAELGGAIGPRTRAIVAVHLYGRPAPMPAIRAVADAHGLVVVEDAAQAHGASWQGVPVGGLGDAAAFSFYPTKNLGALGDGGMVTTRDSEVAARVRRRRTYGLDDGRAVSGGRNSRLDEIQAAFLSRALGVLETDNRRRAEVAARYDAAFRGRSLRVPVTPPGCQPVFHLYPVAVEDRRGFAASLGASGIGTKVHYPHAIHEHPALTRLVRTPGGLDVSTALARQVISLPLYPEIRDDEVGRVIDAVAALRP